MTTTGAPAEGRRANMATGKFHASYQCPIIRGHWSIHRLTVRNRIHAFAGDRSALRYLFLVVIGTIDALLVCCNCGTSTLSSQPRHGMFAAFKQ